jgi:hypothetical protein
MIGKTAFLKVYNCRKLAAIRTMTVVRINTAVDLVNVKMEVSV